MPLLRTTIVITILFSLFVISKGLPSRTQEARKTQEVLSAAQKFLRIEIAPIVFLSKAGEKPYLVGDKVRLKVTARNDSDQRIMVSVVDVYYQNRPRLYKNNQLVPYRAKIAKIVDSKDKMPVFVSSGDSVFVEPYSSVTLTELDLNDWYGPLEPDSYRLISRYRFDLNRAWSVDSEPVLFQVLKQ